MIDPNDVIAKIAERGSESLSHTERVFVVEVFRAAAVSDRLEIQQVKQLIQAAHLEYCFGLEEVSLD